MIALPLPRLVNPDEKSEGLLKGNEVEDAGHIGLSMDFLGEEENLRGRLALQLVGAEGTVLVALAVEEDGRREFLLNPLALLLHPLGMDRLLHEVVHDVGERVLVAFGESAGGYDLGDGTALVVEVDEGASAVAVILSRPDGHAFVGEVGVEGRRLLRHAGVVLEPFQGDCEGHVQLLGGGFRN